MATGGGGGSGQIGTAASGASAGLVGNSCPSDEQPTITSPRQVAPCASSVVRIEFALWMNQDVQKRYPSSGPGGL